MQRFLIVVGMVFMAALVLGGIGVLFLVHYGRHYDADSQASVDKIAKSICKNWDEGVFLKEASPELLEVVHKNQDQIDKLFTVFKERLGPLKEYKGSTGDSYINFNQNGRQITGTYLAKGDFEKGSAQIKIRVILHGDKWQLLLFNVDSNLLLPTS